MDILFSLTAAIGLLAALVLTWPVDGQPRPADGYRIYGR